MKKIYSIVLAFFALVFIAWCSTDAPASTPTESDTSTAVEESTTLVEIVTEYGTMEAVLYDSTPGHRDNFVKLAEEGFYNDLLFHRVIQWFMIQWWDPDSLGAPAWVALGRGGPGYQIDAEIGKPHFKWTLAAARTWWPSNPEKRSSGSQFYIVQGTPQTAESLAQFATQKWITYSAQDIARYVEFGWTPMLDADYTVFGEVVVWLDVIDAIAAVQTAPGDRPLQDVKMTVNVK